MSHEPSVDPLNSIQGDCDAIMDCYDKLRKDKPKDWHTDPTIKDEDDYERAIRKLDSAADDLQTFIDENTD